jgi:arylacetamide deacetylase-like 2
MNRRSFSYRLAPKHPYPAALQDCIAVVEHILEFGDSPDYLIDPRRVVISGDSAGKNRINTFLRNIESFRRILGGNLAAVISMHFATNPVKRYRPCMQVLIYPLLQCFDFTLPSYQEDHYEVYPYEIDYALSVYIDAKLDKTIFQNNHTNAQQKDYYRRLVDRSLIPPEYLRKKRTNVAEYRDGDPALVQRASKALQPDISPLLVEDTQLAKLPITYVLTVGHDRLLDEGLIYVGRLRRCRVPVVHNHYKDTFHASITSLSGMTKLDIAQKMVHDIVMFLRQQIPWI